MSGNVRHLSLLEKLKFTKNAVPQIFEKGVRTPQIHFQIHKTIAKRKPFTVVAVFRGAAKTTVITKIDTAAEIFFNQEPYTQIVSKDHDKARKITADIKKILLGYRKAGFNVSMGEKTADDLFEVVVDGRKCVVEAIGAGEDPRGATADFMRPTRIVVDDLESKQGKYPIGNKKSRKKLADWFDDDLVPGLHPTRGRLIILGTVLSKDGLIARCLKDPDYEKVDIPILRNGKSSWVTRFPMHIITKIKDRFARRGNLSAFYREYMNKPVADEKLIFKPEYFKYFSHVEFEGVPHQREIKNAKKQIFINIQKPKYIVFNDGSKLDLSACTIYTTMDVASGSDTGDRSAIVTCAYDSSGNRYFLEIKSGYWDPFEKGVYAIETYLTWLPSLFGIEKGGMQNDFHSSIAVTQLENDVVIPIYPLEHKGIPKNVRIQNSQPAWIAGRNWLNASDPNTTVLESQYTSFDFESDSDEDDEMDAAAYQERFVNFAPEAGGDDEYEEAHNPWN